VTGGTAVDISFTIKLNSNTSGLIGCGGGGTDKGFYLDILSGDVSFYYSDGATSSSEAFVGIFLSDGVWYDCRIIWDGATSTPTLTVNGSDYTTASDVSGWTGVSAYNLTIAATDGGAANQMNGKLGPCKYDGVFQYNDDYSTGTVAIDSSGNNNDGTLVNSPTWTTDSALPFSHLNQNGYTDDSGLLLPRDESDPTKDTDGNPLQYGGSAFPRRPEYRDSYAVAFDGTNKITLTDDTTDSLLVSGLFYPTSLDKSLVTKGQSRTAPTFHDWDVFQNGSSIIFRGTSSDGSTELFSISCPALTINQWAFVECVWDGVDASISVGGVVCVTLPVSGTLSDRFSANISGDGSFSFEGKQSLITVNDSVYTCAEGVGITAHDTSGNSNDATIIDGSTGTEGAGSWAGRIDGEDDAHNINDGFTLYENGANKLRVPYVNGLPHPSPTIPGGYTLTSENPAVTNGNNGSETTRDCYKIGTGDTVVPETDELENFEAIASGATNYSLGTTSPVDTVFIRDVTEDRLLAFSGTLTGTPLVWVNNFVGGERWNDVTEWDDDTFWNE
jgi:hypothetical protein